MIPGPRSQTFHSRFVGNSVGICPQPRYPSNLCLGLCAAAGLEHQDLSPSHACDVTWATGASLSLFWSLASGPGGLKTVLGIPSFLDLRSRTRAVSSPRWDPTWIPIRPVLGFLEGGAGLPEVLLSHLFFLATDPGGNSRHDIRAHVLRASAPCVVPVLPRGCKHQETQLVPHSPSGPGLHRVHIYLLIHPCIHPWIHSFIHSACLMWAGCREPKRNTLPKFPVW